MAINFRGGQIANYISAHYYKDGLYNMLKAKDGHRTMFIIQWGK